MQPHNRTDPAAWRGMLLQMDALEIRLQQPIYFKEQLFHVVRTVYIRPGGLAGAPVEGCCAGNGEV